MSLDGPDQNTPRGARTALASFDMMPVGRNVADKSTFVAGGEGVQKDIAKFIAGERGPIEGIRFVRH